MTLFHRLASVLRWLVRRDAAEQELDDELQGFIDLSAAAKVRDGVPPAEARRLAAIELGGIEQAKERVRTTRHGGWLDEVGRDVRYALRIFAKRPGFTIVVILTLALGIGANTAIFSLIDALLLRSLPVRAPQELLLLQFQPSDESSPSDSVSYAIVGALADRHEIFAGLAGFSGSEFTVGPAGSASHVSGALVTGGYYETLGLNAAVGRLLTHDDDRRGAQPVAVISYGFWERHFARSATAVGQVLPLNGVPVIVVGVSPRGFVGANVGSIADITIPVAALPQVAPDAAPLLGPGNFWLRVLARPRSRVSAAQAEARLASIWPHIADSVIAPHWPASRRQAMAAGVSRLAPGATGWTFLRGIYEKPLVVLMAMVALVLLIACANVASLLLAQASARRREIAVRLAIGAGRVRIVRQLLIESSLLSAFGALLGVGLAWLSGRVLVNLISTGPARVVFDLTPNWHVLAFTGAIAIATGLIFGVAPALHATAAGPSPALKEGTRTVSGSRTRLLPALVSAQVALSLVLLAGASLFVRTLRNLQHFDPGFRSAGVILADIDGRHTSTTLQQLVDDVQRVPGVLSASVSTHTPLSGSVWSEPAVPLGQPVPDRDTAFFVGAGPRFFSTMEIQLVAGREFTDQDSADSPPVAIVNERFARRYFGAQNPVGRQLSAKVSGERKDLEVIGLVKDTSVAGLRNAPPPTVYVSRAQLTGDRPATLEIRAGGALGAVPEALRQALQHRLPGTTIDVRPLSAQVNATIVQERMMATLAGGFGLLALALACIGLYGLLAYTVARQTQEIGIRMALGAQRKQVVARVLADSARLVLIGIAIGAPATWAAARWVESMMFGLKPTDPTAIGGAILVLVAAAQLAAYLPARRASQVDPLTALRHE